MKTYQIVFGLNPKEGLDLHKVLSDVEKTLKENSRDSVSITRNCWVIRTDRQGPSIRDEITRTIKRYGTDGNILVTDIELTEWCAHCDDKPENRATTTWLKKNVSYQ